MPNGAAAALHHPAPAAAAPAQHQRNPCDAASTPKPTLLLVAPRGSPLLGNATAAAAQIYAEELASGRRSRRGKGSSGTGHD
uniref:Uncharacterized protein n=1 Tax=Leersia perrieri TaxID=77586 RepID=A0A0D9X5S4_9ORYZ